jgi:hypothetical protein
MERKIYFKTQEAFEEFINLLSLEVLEVRKTIVATTCGETNGAYVYDKETTNKVYTLIVDESEFDNASHIERGE